MKLHKQCNKCRKARSAMQHKFDEHPQVDQFTYLVYNHSAVFPFDNEVSIDFDGEIPVVYLQDFKVVEPDGDVHRAAVLLI